MNHLMEDREAIERCQGSETEAFCILVERYMRRAYFIALAMVGSHEDALDLSQEAFVRAYRSIGTFAPGQAFLPWFYRILRNLCLNHLRDKRRSESILSEMEESSLPEDFPDPSLLAERNELKEAAWKALSCLKPHEREIILLRDLHGFSYREIAEAIRCPIGTVMSRLFNARRALKEKLIRHL